MMSPRGIFPWSRTRPSRRRVRPLFAAAGAAGAGAGLVGGSTSSGAPPGAAAKSSAPAVKGGTVSYGFVSGDQPNWIFPYDTPAYSSDYNLDDFQELMYRPLYWFGGQNDQPTVDYGLSAANAPVYTD